MNKEYQIRQLQVQDLDQVVAIEKENFSTPWTRADYEGCIEKESSLVLVAKECGSDVIYGYIGATISFDEADICNVSVDKRREGKGIGSALVWALTEALQQRGVKSIFLEVRESNAGAIHLYEKFAFQQIGLRKNYYRKPTENALVMKREQ